MLNKTKELNEAKELNKTGEMSGVATLGFLHAALPRPWQVPSLEMMNSSMFPYARKMLTTQCEVQAQTPHGECVPSR